MKVIAPWAFVLNSILFATSYAVSKEAIVRLDPVVFLFFEMLLLSPVALLLLALSWRSASRAAFRRGIALGVWMSLALLAITTALKFTSATDTAFFPCLNGLVGALIAAAVLRQRVAPNTWAAGLFSLVGACLLISSRVTEGQLRGNGIALLGMLLFTCYLFQMGQSPAVERSALVTTLAVQYLTMTCCMTLAALLFGNWQDTHPQFPKDLWVLLYIGILTDFLPTLIALFMQRYVSALTVAFIYMLEPILGAAFATLYLGEALQLQGYIGGSLVVAAVAFHTWHESRQPPRRRQVRRRALTLLARLKGSSPGTVFRNLVTYPALLGSAGIVLIVGLGGFPPPAWRTLLRLLPTLPSAWAQEETSTIILGIQAICAGIAWGALVALTALLAANAARNIRSPVPPPRAAPVLAGRRGEKALVLKRRRKRLLRLGMLEEVNGPTARTGARSTFS